MTSKQCIVHTGGWEGVRSHPAMAWMEKYTAFFDRRDYDSLSSWHSPSYTYTKSTGETFSSGDASNKAVVETYAPFRANLHDPKFLVVWETEKGWEMFGVAVLYADLVAEGEKKVRVEISAIEVPFHPDKPVQATDQSGKQWDLAIPSAFKFRYVKDDAAEHDGILMESTSIFSDPTSAVVEMLKRGMLKPEQLMG